MVMIEVEQVTHVRSTPGVDGLVGVAHDEQVAMMTRKDLHELVLQSVDILELVDHDVLQAFLPLELDVGVSVEQVQCEHDEVVVIEPEALFLLVKITEEDDLIGGARVKIALPEVFDGHGQHFAVVQRMFLELHHLDHVARFGKRHVAQGQPALFVNDLQHAVDIGVVEHKEAFWIAERMAVLLQNRHAKAVERVYVAGVVVACDAANAAAHFVGGFVGEGDAQDVARHDAEVAHQVRESLGECAGLSRAGSGDDAYVALGGGDGFSLGGVEPGQSDGPLALPTSSLRPRMSYPSDVRFASIGKCVIFSIICSMVDSIPEISYKCSKLIKRFVGGAHERGLPA